MSAYTELKDKNASAETEVSDPPQDEDIEIEEQAAETETEVVEDDAESSDDKPDEETVELWAQTEAEDGTTSEDAEKTFTETDIAGMRQKISGRYKRQADKAQEGHSEQMRLLQEENNRLKQGAQVQPQTGLPTREQFENMDDPDAALMSATVKYHVDQQTSVQKANTVNQQAKQKVDTQLADIKSKTDQHYANAIELVKDEKNNIRAEVYEAADTNVRNIYRSIYPDEGLGDLQADLLISKMGKNSEKVMFHLGANRSKLNHFESLLRQDPSGLEAFMYVGELKAGLLPLVPKSTAAPDPANTAHGDASTVDRNKAAMKKYQAAVGKDDIGAAVTIKRQAKANGADVSTWT